MSCPICECGKGDWCRSCAKAWDRASRLDDGTIRASVEWAARRAWRFARRREREVRRRFRSELNRLRGFEL